MRTAIIIPTLGSTTLGACLDAVHELDSRPTRVIVVASGGAAPATPGAELLCVQEPLGFAAAVNAGLERVLGETDAVAVVNDDALVSPQWLATLERRVSESSLLAAVQGTVTNRGGVRIDGQGIELDTYALPVQINRGKPAGPEAAEHRPIVAASGTAALLRSAALRQASGDFGVLDPGFGSYHEDLDLGLRLRRLGWSVAWTAGAPCRHVGSATGARFRWRHPWWVLTNRWRAVAGNLTPSATLRLLPRMLRGEIRAARTLARDNPRAMLISVAAACAIPALIVSGWQRQTPGPRLHGLPGPGS